MPAKRTTKPKRAVNAQPELPAAVAKVLAGHKANTDSGALLASLIERWGGTERLAADIYSEFDAAPKGGMTRQRIIEMIQRLIITNTTHEIGKARNPSDMSDDELAATAMNYLRRMTGDATSTPGQAIRPEEEGD
jgi:hypothetical protein